MRETWARRSARPWCWSRPRRPNRSRPPPASASTSPAPSRTSPATSRAPGCAAAWASAVGADALGRRLVATLARRGVDTSLVAVDPAAPTGVFFKDPGTDGTRVLYYRRGSAASRLGPAFAAGLPLASAPIVHVSGITAALSDSCRDLLEEVIAVRARHGLPVSFDVNHRPALWEPAVAAPVLLDLARRCDLVFVGPGRGADVVGHRDRRRGAGADRHRQPVGGQGRRGRRARVRRADARTSRRPTASRWSNRWAPATRSRPGTSPPTWPASRPRPRSSAATASRRRALATTRGLLSGMDDWFERAVRRRPG